MSSFSTPFGFQASDDQIRIIGIMSGTSLDGVDIAHCTFKKDEHSYYYTINACETIAYSSEWFNRLRHLHLADANQYAVTHVEYGRLLGVLVREFLDRYNLPTDFIASHGHTVFHQPSIAITSQIGEGAALAAESGLPVICDFRTGDVALGGQGAPLVPIGDELLFPAYTYCLNLGGFANISYNDHGIRRAFDICPVNFVLNYLANKTGEPYDRGGKLAASGIVDPILLEKLNNLPFYKQQPPKSLGREWVEKELLPLIENSLSPVIDKLATLVEHISFQIANVSVTGNQDSMLITGGGAKNSFLIKKLREKISCSITIPDNNLIDYKEALVFAFLGMLRVQGIPNCLASVTGASKDACGGAIYLP